MDKTITMDTYRPFNNDPMLVRCYAQLPVINGPMLYTVGYGMGRSGSNQAFDRMEEALDELGFGEYAKVRIY